MSQGNGGHPAFNFNVEHFMFDAGAPQPIIHNAQQWAPNRQRSRPKSVQYNLPSPSASVRSAVTAPAPSYDRADFLQPTHVSVNERNDPTLLGLEYSIPTPGHVAGSSYSPITRSSHEGPWDPLHLRNSVDESSLSQHPTGFKNFRNGPGSISSIVPPSDSGFWTQSVGSHEPGRFDQSYMPFSLAQQVNKLQVRSVTSETPRTARVLSDQRSQISHLSSQSGNQDQPLKCNICGEEAKCKSDYKKHILKHEKPFKCDQRGCKRSISGFTTVNDLDRHKKSVHRIGLDTKSYQCASVSCRNKEKIWPRLDNFKQHVDRIHQGEDQEDLIKRSVYTPKNRDCTPGSVSVAPLETVIAGMGEKTFSGQDGYGPRQASETIVDPSLSQWPAKLNPADLPLGLCQISSPQVNQSCTSSKMDRSKSHGSLLSQTSGTADTQAKLRNEPTDVAKYAQPVRKFGAEPQKKPQGKISNAPQTKAQQQREALSKLSQAVSNEMDGSSSSKEVDLEDLVLRILKRTTGLDEDGDDQAEYDQGPSRRRGQPERKVTLTKSEAIKASQAISNIIKQSPGSAFSQPRKTTQGFGSHSKVCELCGYAVARVCDLKKHMKRHEKPYGCTYPKCNKRFGAKSDWKRHENSQHFQLEAFRCRKLTTGNKICGEHFFRSTGFKEHLMSKHKMGNPDEVEQEIRCRRIGKNCQQQFWCGFHNEIIELKERRNAAWDERFDHIADHFEKDKKSIEEWVCAEENKTKKELLKEMDRYVFDDDEQRRGSGKQRHSSPAPHSPPLPPSLDPNLLPPPPAIERPPPPPELEAPQQTAGHKHKLQSDAAHEQPHKRAKQYIQIQFCCQCNEPFGQQCDACLCNHRKCQTCRTEVSVVYV